MSPFRLLPAVFVLFLTTAVSSEPTALGRTMEDRFDAVLSICDALEADGLLTPEDAALRASLVEHRRTGNAAALSEALARAERQFGSRRLMVPVVFWADPTDGTLYGIEDSRPVAAEILVEGRDYHVMDLACDDMTIYELLRNREDLRWLAASPSIRPISGGVVPPPEWVPLTAAVDRWSHLARLAGRTCGVTYPAVEAGAPGFREWMAAATRRRPAEPIAIRASSADLLGSWYAMADSWIVDLGWDTSGASAVRGLWQLSRIASPGAAVVLPRATPWLTEMEAALEEMRPGMRAVSTRQEGVAGFISGRRLVLVNISREPVRMDVVAAPRPRLRGASGEAEAGGISAVQTVLRDDGRYVETTRLDYGRRLGAVLPPSSVNFIFIESQVSIP